jgi:hypothetical protein
MFVQAALKMTLRWVTLGEKLNPKTGVFPVQLEDVCNHTPRVQFQLVNWANEVTVVLPTIFCIPVLEFQPLQKRLQSSWPVLFFSFLLATGKVWIPSLNSKAPPKLISSMGKKYLAIETLTHLWGVELRISFRVFQNRQFYISGESRSWWDSISRGVIYAMKSPCQSISKFSLSKQPTTKKKQVQHAPSGIKPQSHLDLFENMISIPGHPVMNHLDSTFSCDASVWIQTRLSGTGLSWRHHMTFSQLKPGLGF